MSAPLYVSSEFVGELLRALLLALSGLKHGTMTVDDAVGVYDYWLDRLGDEVGGPVSDDPKDIPKGEN